MDTPSEEFRRVYLPYCIERVEGRGHVVLNRLYKPLGVRSRDWVDYAPHAVKFKGLTPRKAAQISHTGSGELDRVFLYHDGSIPTRSSHAWEAYQQRLRVLAMLKVQ